MCCRDCLQQWGQVQLLRHWEIVPRAYSGAAVLHQHSPQLALQTNEEASLSLRKAREEEATSGGPVQDWQSRKRAFDPKYNKLRWHKVTAAAPGELLVGDKPAGAWTPKPPTFGLSVGMPSPAIAG